jgi:hypothetical protein
LPLPSMEEFSNHAHESLAVQASWAHEHFGVPLDGLTLEISDAPTASLGQMRVSRQHTGDLTYKLKIQSYHYIRDEIIAYREYSSYNGHPVIGGFKTSNWRLSLDALISHEMAHVVDYGLKEENHRAGGHGLVFQGIYGQFRQRFVNQQLTDQDFVSPREDFLDTQSFNLRIREATEPNHPLVGMEVMLRRGKYVVVGRNPSRTKIYNYMVADPQGNLARIKLSLILQSSPEARSSFASDMQLSLEAQEHFRALHGLKGRRHNT